eukprot:TRINITY_DN18346_c0_g1_i1.p1 TRINITY_DN18346_c0_g1~~TRINITY_DN18346_c0_g1_i1.p1  ORF type:complete len:123 (+),score=38.98 TRINITY_DN18346_c0_g1_i1:49-417(+)
MVTVTTNKSGRPWKKGKKKISTLNATAASKTSFAVRREKQKKQRAVKAIADDLKKESDRKKEQERKRLEALKKKKSDDLLKSVKVQVIKDSKKIKRMSKKQIVKSRIYLNSHLTSASGVSDR